jgi:predicted nuclease with TOPRIM domain
MAELDKIPQKTTVELAQVTLDETVIQSITDLTQKQNMIISDLGQIHLRKKEMAAETIRLDDVTEQAEDEFKAVSAQLQEIFDSLDEQYPQGRVNLEDNTITYQPGAPTRKQLLEQQQQQQQPKQQSSNSGMKVVKE